MNLPVCSRVSPTFFIMTSNIILRVSGESRESFPRACKYARLALAAQRERTRIELCFRRDLSCDSIEDSVGFFSARARAGEQRGLRIYECANGNYYHKFARAAAVT